MSLLVRSTHADQHRFVYVYDAPADWSVEAGHPADDPYLPKIEGNDRTGIWFGSSRDQDRWAAWLLRDEAPFNDCLPPTGSILHNAWRNSTNRDEFIQQTVTLGEDEFLNPFDVYSGSWTKTSIKHRRQSFQTNSEMLDQELFAVYNRDNQNPDSLITEDRDNLQNHDELVATVTTSVDNGGLFHEDARLPTRASVVITSENSAKSQTISVITNYPDPQVRTEQLTPAVST